MQQNINNYIIDKLLVNKLHLLKDQQVQQLDRLQELVITKIREEICTNALSLKLPKEKLVLHTILIAISENDNFEAPSRDTVSALPLYSVYK